MEPPSPNNYADQQLENRADIAMTSIYGFLYLVGIPLFILLRNREPIRSRGWLIATMQMTVALVDLILRSLTWRRTTCMVDNWRGVLVIPLWIYPYYGRAFVLWYNFNLQQVLLLRRDHATRKGKMVLWLQSRPWFVSIHAQLTLFGFLAISFTLVAFAIYFTEEMPPGVCNLPSAFYVEVVQGVIATVLVLVTIPLLWSVQDIFGLKHEFVYLLVTGFPLFVVWALSIARDWSGLANDLFWIDLAEVLFIVGTIYMPLLGTWAFTRILPQKDAAEYERNGHDEVFPVRTTGGEDELALILSDEVLLGKLKEFMIHSWTIENYLFLQKLQEYRNLPGHERSQAAMVIRDEFIREGKESFACLLFFSFFLIRVFEYLVLFGNVAGSICQVNIDMRVRDEILGKIEAGEIDEAMFREAEKGVSELMNHSILPLWKASASYKEAMRQRNIHGITELRSLRGETALKVSGEEQLVLETE